MTDAYQALDSLRTVLTKKREDVKEAMANGFEDEKRFQREVGYCKALRDAIGMVSDQIKSLSGGIDDDETKRTP